MSGTLDASVRPSDAQETRPDSMAGRRPAACRPLASAAPAALSARSALALLVVARLVSAAVNIIHDCDETYNYLEPLHFLLFGSGMQTWEYSPQYALRSYLYLLLHAPFAGAPAALLGRSRAGKLAGFYTLKAALGLASAASEAALYRAVAASYRPAVAHATLLFLCISSGMFAAATSLLPSTFTMYALTAAAAGVLQRRPRAVIAAAVVGERPCFAPASRALFWMPAGCHWSCGSCGGQVKPPHFLLARLKPQRAAAALLPCRRSVGLVRCRPGLPPLRPVGVGGGALPARARHGAAVPGGHAGPAGAGGPLLLWDLDGE